MRSKENRTDDARRRIPVTLPEISYPTSSCNDSIAGSVPCARSWADTAYYRHSARELSEISCFLLHTFSCFHHLVTTSSIRVFASLCFHLS